MERRFTDIFPGQTFGRWTVIGHAESNKHGHPRWLCRCSCPLATIRAVMGRDLRSGHSRSCGCLRDELSAERNTHQFITHGHARAGKVTPEYRVFASAKNRCNNQSNHAYADYGARGIRFLFTSFEQFYAEVGPRPPGMTLDRIDNDGHYEPGNIRWTTQSEQNRNQRPRNRRAIPSLFATASFENRSAL